jgi:hypothetical protein
MKLKTIGEVYSTEDCLIHLNEYKQSKWKRKHKFLIKAGNKDEEFNLEVRVFSDGIDTLSIIATEDSTYLANINMYPLRDLIHRIQSISNKFYTYDYGEVFLDPWSMELWVVGSDGGICYSDLSVTKLVKKLQEDEDGFHDEFWDSEISHSAFIPEITKCRFEAEYYPPLEEEDLSGCGYDEENQVELKWIRVATCTNLSNYDIY